MTKVKVYFPDGEFQEHICDGWSVKDGFLYISNRNGSIAYPLVSIKKFETERY
jgi:hypothetical protein